MFIRCPQKGVGPLEFEFSAIADMNCRLYDIREGKLNGNQGGTCKSFKNR